MTQEKKKNKAKKRVSRTTARQEEIHTHLYSAEDLGKLFERLGWSNQILDNPGALSR